MLVEENKKNQGGLTPDPSETPKAEPELETETESKVEGDPQTEIEAKVQEETPREEETAPKESWGEKSTENQGPVQESESSLEIKEAQQSEKEQDLQNEKLTQSEVPSEPKETGILESIKNEIKNTPRPKKILVSIIVITMAVVSILGFAVYGIEGKGKEVSAIPSEEKPELKPAKLLLTLEDKKYELDLLQLGYDGKDPKSTDMKQLTAWLDKVRDEVSVKPKNAYYKKDYWKNPIIRGKYGQDMNVEEMKKWLENWHSYINKPYEIPMVSVEPEVTSDDLRNVHLKLIGSYTTMFNPGNANRTTNIRLAANEIHNLVMLPGDKFSFNKVVGERTEARGYKTAHVIVKGEYTEGIGGGICQLSSTLYNSTDRAGLKMLRVIHHSANVDYVPKGRDATVSWGGPDFRFQNNLDAPILLRVFVNNGKLTVNVYTVPGAKVKNRDVAPAPESFTEIPVDEEGKSELSSKQPTQP